MSKVVLTIEFPNVLAAADALNLISGAVAHVQVIPLLPVAVSPGQALTGEGVPVTPALADVQPTPQPTVTDKPARKPRADAGKPRGPHKPTEEPGKAPVDADKAPSPGVVPAPATSTPATTAAPTSNPLDGGKPPTKEDASAALGRINKTAGLGMPAVMEHLAQFGVNRLSLLPEEKYALFIKHADEKIAEHLKESAKK